MNSIEIDGIIAADLHIVDTDLGHMVGCTLALDGKFYNCAEYFDTYGHVQDDANSHMTVNGILNVQTARMEPFVSNGMERDDYVRWTNAENVVRGAMQAFVTDKLFPSEAASCPTLSPPSSSAERIPGGIAPSGHSGGRS